MLFAVPQRRRFSLATLRGLQQPGLSKRMNRLVKTENLAISAYERAGRERVSIASQLSEWGESTEDEAVSDISDKLGVLLAEIGEQEDVFAQNLEDYRTLLKHIRDTEGSVQPSRDYRAKVADDIQKQKIKDASSPKLETLEQELVRAEAQNLVAEAQLTNMTRQKLKEAYDVHLAAVIERGEKQILLAQHARRLLNYLDDTPVTPGDTRTEYENADEAREVLEDAEKDLSSWQSTVLPIHTSAGEVPANTLLPAPARKAREAREAQRVSMVAPDADGVASTSDSIRDVNGSAVDYHEYEPVADGGGVALGTGAHETGRYASGATRDLDSAGAGYMEAPAVGAGTTRDMIAEPSSAIGQGIDISSVGVPEMTSAGAGAATNLQESSTGAAVNAATIPSEVDGLYRGTGGISRGLDKSTTEAEGLYKGTHGTASGMKKSTMDSQGFDGTAAYASRGLHGSSTQTRDFNSSPGVASGLDHSATGVSKGSNNSYAGAASATGGENLFKTTGGTITGMDGATMESQGLHRSTVNAATDTDGLTQQPREMYQSAADATEDDFQDAYTSPQGKGFDESFSKGSDVGGYTQEARDLNGSATGTAMNGTQETMNVEESVSQGADGSMTTMTRETLVRNTKPLIDGGQATRERLQSQPAFGGFGLQSIGVPY
ncbi:hypothetical protein FE257_009298 [Aspergillus nanangensis]|uniref:Eisosome component PIL1-domain-containing protein n=1 Tax=Aspergillus nanangensis TaxID=2582783 RepID=A0AAD4CK66_ASPNN|nr:hypothetical protein FE257_009298 [Aspergillus nanangensis]